MAQQALVEAMPATVAALLALRSAFVAILLPPAATVPAPFALLLRRRRGDRSRRLVMPLRLHGVLLRHGALLRHDSLLVLLPAPMALLLFLHGLLLLLLEDALLANRLFTLHVLLAHLFVARALLDLRPLLLLVLPLALLLHLGLLLLLLGRRRHRAIQDGGPDTETARLRVHVRAAT